MRVRCIPFLTHQLPIKHNNGHQTIMVAKVVRCAIIRLTNTLQIEYMLEIPYFTSLSMKIKNRFFS